MMMRPSHLTTTTTTTDRSVIFIDSMKPQQQQQQQNKRKRKNLSDIPKKTSTSKRQRKNTTSTVKKGVNKTVSELENQNIPYSFNVHESSNISIQLSKFEKILSAYCLDIYNICSAGSNILLNHPTVDKLGRNIPEHHLAKALYHLEKVVSTTADNTTSSLKDIQDKSSKILEHLRKISNQHDEAHKICKKVITTMQRMRKVMDEWDRWRIQYISELRINYDPTLCGGISKPLLDVFSAQSNASKYRLGIMNKMNEKKEEILNEIKDIQEELKEGNNEKELLELSSNVLELSRNEIELAHLDIQDKMNRNNNTTELSSIYRNNRQSRAKSLDLKYSKNSPVTIDETVTAEDEINNTDKMMDCSSYDMPDLLTFGDKTEKATTTTTTTTAPSSSSRTFKNKKKDITPSFFTNTIQQIDVTLNRGNNYNTPLDKVNWASKTSVRLPQNIF